MTYLELCNRLTDCGIATAAWDAALLLEHFCKADINKLAGDSTNYDTPELYAAVERRQAHEPLQYILGEWQFFRQTYTVSPDCLIPRSDTEILVEEAIRRLPQNATFADLCTGSGCIAVSLAAERPDTHGLAVDKFPNTLAVAQKNALRNGVADRLELALCDVLEEDPLQKKCFNAILSNPPYIPTEVLESLAPEVKKEPQAALDGGGDGLIFYRALLKLKKNLTPGGCFLFEIGYDQAEAVTALCRKEGLSATVIKDLGGNDRVVIAYTGEE